ncbi:MAG: cation:proton antiporter [Mycobacteriales bacterium]
MDDAQAFGLLVLVVAAAGLAAVLSNRLTARLQVPTPALFLAAAAVAAAAIPDLHSPPRRTVERLVTVALIVILFDGGMHIGWRRFRAAAAPITTVGVLGTFLTTGAIAVVARPLFGLDWYLAVLLGAALAPTDPAVVFSVLGQRQLSGRSGTILEGESGANDPVGIALMVSLLGAGGLGLSATVDVTGQFLLQMLVGAAVGVVGGRGLLWFMRAVPLPSEGLYPLRTLASAFLAFGIATVAHGSGFLAVFVAGICLGDGRAPYKREIRRFHSALASLGEIVAFVVLGLTVDLSVIARPDVWVPGLALGALLTVLIRPLMVGLCLARVELDRKERAFVLFAGLKGAVPILLGSFLLAANVPHSQRLYGIVVVVVAFSVLVQGGLVPTAVRLLRLPIHTVEPEPWALGVRLRAEPDRVHQLRVAAGSRADGHTIGQINSSSSDVWVSLVVRSGRLVPVSGATELHAGDDVLVLADPALRAELEDAFRPPPGPTARQVR